MLLFKDFQLLVLECECAAAAAWFSTTVLLSVFEESEAVVPASVVPEPSNETSYTSLCRNDGPPSVTKPPLLSWFKGGPVWWSKGGGVAYKLLCSSLDSMPPAGI